MSKTFSNALDKASAQVMADLIADPTTPENLRVNIITKIMESREGQDFFQTMFEESLSLGECPDCGHENHWAIPEDILNEMGWVSYEKDPRVPKHTTRDECDQYQEACAKKKIGI
jgi:Zn ribbon nucleic-acid-binding protein